ncbi:unannotated protein [freshwater metagenome]|uniref:Unannotated protein n=1 Tax=freshwater metagenome TaxID=449393 RepID=A0A6J6ZIE4_9ZZZZ
MKFDDIGPQCTQIFFVVVATNDNQDMPTFEFGPNLGDNNRLKEQPSFFLDVLQCVDSKAFEFVTNRIASQFHLGLNLFKVKHLAATDFNSITKNPAILNSDGVSVAEFAHDGGADSIHHCNPGLGNPFGATVGVSARNSGACVNHCGYLRRC